MKNKLKTININIIIFLLNFFIYKSAFSEIIKNFDIKGNFRVSNETVIMFSNLKIGDNVTKNDLNEALKNLYYTDYFKDVSISLEDGYLKIVLIENPIIQSVEIKGVKQNNIKFIIPDKKKFPLIEIIQLIPEKTSYFETILITLNDTLVEKYLNGKINYISIQRNLLKLIKTSYFSKFYKLKPKNIYDIKKIIEITNVYLNDKVKNYV